ncbi:MAG: TetR family transcriptional regulator [Methylophilaceae bacterium]
MVRKTKEEAELTRQCIINAAREVFINKGVSKTSLEEIAKHAGVTRGAVYWHFTNKSDLLHAMRDQVVLPLIDRMDDALLLNLDKEHNPENDPLTRIENFLLCTIQVLSDHQETRQTYEIMMTKCEYVGEFEKVMQQIMSNCSSIVDKLEQAYTKALKKELINYSLNAAQYAQDTHLFFSGLLHMWVKDTDGNRYRNQAQTLIHTHIKMRRK